MKPRWLMAAVAVALLTMTGDPAVAQGRGHGNQQNRGQEKKAARQFAAQERQAAQQWAQQHRAQPPRGFRRADRLPPRYETRIAPGYVFGIFCGMMVLQLIWVKTMVPETKGVPLEQMQKKLGIL